MKTLILLFSVLFITMSFAQVPNYVPTNGLVGWWPFNGNANDESGSANNGTVNGATLTNDRFNITNKAYSFDGNNSEILFNSNFIFHQNTDATISFWFKKNQCPNFTNGYYQGTLIWSSISNIDLNRFNFYFRENPNNIFTVDYKEPIQNTHDIVTTTNIFDSIWTNIVISRQLDNYKLFINGNLIDSIIDINPSLPNSIGYLIGNDPASNSDFAGSFDDLGIWNRALTQQEITNLYTSTVPPTAAVLSGDATICAGTSTNLSVAVTGGTAPYTVTVTDGTNNYSATGASPVSIPVSPTATSTYSIVSVTGGGTGTGNTGTATVTVTPNPTAIITALGTTTFCSGGSVVLTASTGTLYSWSTGATTASITATTSGTYTVMATDIVNGCSGISNSISVTVFASPTATITSGGPTTFCSGGSVVLTASGGTSYSWSTGATTQAITATTAGLYTVQVTDNVNGCSGISNSIVVTVIASPTAIITPTGPLTFCSGGSVVLTASGGTSYSWSTGATTQAITATTAGLYTVQVTDNVNGCISLSAPTVLTITPSSTNTTTATACNSYVWNGTTYTASGVYTGTTANCVTQSLNLTINTNTSSSISQTALDSYTWPVNSQTYTTTGAYTAVIPNASGCDSTITLNLTMSFTGMNDLSASKLSIYPNPTNGDFTITGLELVGTVSSLTLTDMNGKVVKVLDTKATKFSMALIKPGVYFLNIISGNKQEVLKIVKE